MTTYPTQTGNPVADELTRLTPHAKTALMDGVDRHIATTGTLRLGDTSAPPSDGPVQGAIPLQGGPSPAPDNGAIPLPQRQSAPMGMPEGITAPGAIPVPQAAAKPAVAGAIPVPAKFQPAPTPMYDELSRVTKAPLQGDQAHTKADTGRSGIGQIHNPWARIPVQILDAVGRFATPGLEAAIPGTEGYHQGVVADAQDAAKTEQSANESVERQRHESAQTEHEQAETAGLPDKAANEAAEAKYHTAQAEALKNPDMDEISEGAIDPSDPTKTTRIAWTNKRGTPGNITYGPAIGAKPTAPHIQTDPKEIYTEAVADAFKRGVDPAKDPKVQQAAKAVTEIQKQPAEKEPQRDDKYISIQAKPAAQRTEEENAYVKGYEKYVQETKVQPGVVRMETMGGLREMPVLDTKNGNTPMFLSAADINEANRKEPGRYMPPGVGAPALTKTALIEDIRGNVQQVRESLNAMPELSGGDRAKIAIAMRSRDPKSAISALISSAAIPDDPHLQDYLINLTNLHENAMAMRSVLGAGQGSEDLRSAILAVVPGPQTPNKKFALKQLDTFEKTLDRLSKGIPQVKLSGQQQQNGGNSGGDQAKLKAFADEYFGGDLVKAQAEIDHQRQGAKK